MARAASSRLYNPADPNSIVALETRCDIVGTVLKHEPGTWSTFMEAVAPLQGKLPYWTDDIKFLCVQAELFGLEHLATLLIGRDLQIEHNERAYKWNKWAERQGDKRLRTTVYPDKELEALNSKIDRLLEAMQGGHFFGKDILLVADIYRGTCLRSLGVGVFTLLLRFVAFCTQEGYDPKNYGLIHHMASAASKMTPFKVDQKVSPYKLVLLSLGKYAQSLGKLEGMKNPRRSQMSAWFFDVENEEYVSYRFRLEEDAAAEDFHVAQVQRETWQDYKKRRKDDAKKRGIRVYTGSRKEATAKDNDYDDHNYLVYLYEVKGMGSDEVAELVYPDASRPDNAVNSIEKAIARRLKLAWIPYFPFGEKRKLLTELEWLKTAS